MAPVNVAIVGASGKTGSSIMNGLLAMGNFNITALTRPGSLQKPENIKLQSQGVTIESADLAGPEEELIRLLSSIDVVISAVGMANQLDQFSLATAAKRAGVKRFVPCGFITVAPAGGVMLLRDQKEEVYNHVKKLHLPYTFIDVGWWYQIAFPKLPSGKIDYVAVSMSEKNEIPGDGNVPSALTDLRDIGHYVARIITDTRTLNRSVLAYNTVFTPNETFELLEKLSGENIERTYVSEAEILKRLKKPPSDVHRIFGEYLISWGIRGDNTPEIAKYLGYLTTKELYPDFKFTQFEDYLKDVIKGIAKGINLN